MFQSLVVGPLPGTPAPEVDKRATGWLSESMSSFITVGAGGFGISLWALAFAVIFSAFWAIGQHFLEGSEASNVCSPIYESQETKSTTTDCQQIRPKQVPHEAANAIPTPLEYGLGTSALDCKCIIL